MIARANKKARKAGVEIDLRNALVESLPFRDGEFDVVLSTLMLHHLPRKLRMQCAAEVRRILKTEGRLLAIDCGATLGSRGLVAPFHRHGYINLEEMAMIFSEAGLNVREKGAVGIGDLQYLVAVAPRSSSSTPTSALSGHHECL